MLVALIMLLDQIKVIGSAFSNYVPVESSSSITWLPVTVEPGERLSRSRGLD